MALWAKGRSAKAMTATGSATFARNRTSMRSRRTNITARITTAASTVASTRNRAPTPSTPPSTRPDDPESSPATAMMSTSFHGTA